MPHHQLNKLVHKKIQFESSSSSSYYSSSFSTTNACNSHTSPTAPIHSNNNILRCFHHKPKFKKIFSHSSSSSSHASRRTWDRFKSLCVAHLPLMADSSVHFPLELKKSKHNAGVQKKEELEREVSVLNKMLSQEQRVHEYLQRLNQRQNGSALTIPSFLPPKMKEILAELAMVENEITRLESQIKHLQDELKLDNDANIHKKYKEWEAYKHEPSPSPLPLPPHPHNATRLKGTPFETKALHFISKAIKGDYHVTNNNNNNNSSSDREKLSKRNGLLKPPSPLREPRHPTPRHIIQRDRSLDVPTEYPTKVMATPLHTEEESIHRWPPNKLSENIMKCLVFIYVRLLRTSRAMEMEKAGSIARSTNFSLSFRADTNTAMKTSQMFHKDSRQQDPYGIFDSEMSVPRDIGPYKNLVRFTSSSMDLKCIQNSSSVPLFQKLKVLMDGLQKVDLRFLSHQQKLAFWINMYNACIMHGYLQYGVPSLLNHETLQALINKATLNIGGNTMNAQAIEHFILRKAQDPLIKEVSGKDNKASKETMVVVGELYGIDTPDPNIIFALCRGTRSSPAVKIYTAEGVAAELEKSKLEYLQAAIMVTAARKIGIPELVLTNCIKDFGSDKEALMEWVCHQLPTSGSLRKSIVDCFRPAGKASPPALLEIIPYEFNFQYLLVI